jgi:hypothetical protein
VAEMPLYLLIIRSHSEQQARALPALLLNGQAGYPCPGAESEPATVPGDFAPGPKQQIYLKVRNSRPWWCYIAGAECSISCSSLEPRFWPRGQR